MTQLITALDVETLDEAKRLMERIGEHCRFYKIGSRLFTTCGPAAIKAVHAAGAQVFLDLKYHDIPQTVKGAVIEATRHQVALIDVHALGGADMMCAAADACRRESGRLGIPKPLLIAVTILTSHDRQALNSMGIMRSVRGSVLHLGKQALGAGLDGLVCSAQELKKLRQVLGKDAVLVVPGIRPANSAAGDQKRIATPAEAASAGADYIVVGRPILDASDPAAAAAVIREEFCTNP
ncbi:MAG: orotidine-5'-phosphate decarboxylase [Candidatus Omnitrophica bacterium]|nr:orotidine-5'-phosphate decarboxylase [Candidatus Omnitrophota bacterium]